MKDELIKKENKIKDDEIVIKRNTKDNIIEKEKENFLFGKKQFDYDNKFYSSYYMFSEKNKNKKGYEIILYTHQIEKGLSHFELRPFGKDAIKNLINCLKEYISYNNYENDFSFINGINSLKE